LEWHYLAVSLPAPLPQLFLEATGAGPLTLELPRPVEGQRLTVGGQLDRRFTVYAPPGYGVDAMYVLTPVVIAALIDHADRYHIEVTGDTLVFFSPVLADFTEQEPWLAVDAVLQEVVPAVVRQAERYRDERGPGQRSTLWWEPRPVSGSRIREAAGHLLVYSLLVWRAIFAFFGLVQYGGSSPPIGAERSALDPGRRPRPGGSGRVPGVVRGDPPGDRRPAQRAGRNRLRARRAPAEAEGHDRAPHAGPRRRRTGARGAH